MKPRNRAENDEGEPWIVMGSHAPEKVTLARRLRDEKTPAEQALWRRLRARRLAGLHFRQQQIIDGFIVDFYCHSAALVIECDGEVHASQRSYDEERDAILTLRGLRILRFPNSQVLESLEAVLADILAAAESGTG